MKMLQEYWASTVIFIGIFSQCKIKLRIELKIKLKCELEFELTTLHSVLSKRH